VNGKNQINVVRVFLIYSAFVGDVDKTASALNLDPDFVRKLAKDEGWNEQLRRITLLSKTGRPGDFERAQNRALSFVQAHQTSELLNRVLEQFSGMTNEEIIEAIASVAKDGSRHVSGRFFADLTAAMEKCHSMKYAALGDTAGERVKRVDNDSEEMNATALHMAVMSALNNPKVKAIDVESELKSSVDVTVKQIADSPEPPSPEPKPSS
jgi:hypothetical protein